MGQYGEYIIVFLINRTTSQLDLALAILGIVLLTRLMVKIYPSALSLPPGPKKLPIIGNLLDMPSEREWETFAKWGETWGDITSVSMFGKSLVVINSLEAALDILDKKSLIYSDRPILQMGGELVGWKNTMGLMQYSDRLRHYRKLIHRLFGTRSSMSQFYPQEEAETRRFLQRVLEDPLNLPAHVRRTSGAIILRIAYGYKAEEENDPLIQVVDTAMEQFSVIATPGAFLVDSIPILRYIPEWVPGAGFQKTAKSWAKMLSKMVERPYSFTKEQMAAGTAEASFTSTLLEQDNLSIEEETAIRWTAASMYAAGSDTSVSSIYSLFRAMASYPEVQRKAQAELDAVTGNDRLPTFLDRPHLPYIDALCKEVMRHHTVTPIGVPRRVREDNVHAGYLIPKGTTVVANIWKMLHDPRTYKHPSVFNPERFIETPDVRPERDPGDICFGFGRRTCPGKLLAEASVFIMCAMSLAVFDISAPKVDGAVLKVVEHQTSGIVSHPEPFECVIRPRSDKALALISGEIHQ